MRVIDADKLIELIDDDIAAHKAGYFEDFELPPTAYGSLCALRMAREYINALPTIEAVPKHYDTESWKTTTTEEGSEYAPVKHGRWIEDEYGIPHCSECKAINNTVYRNYCPNCGAKMDLDEVEE